MKPEFSHASESFKRLNPQLFGAVAPTHHQKPKRNQRGQSPNRVLEQVPNGVAIRVHFVAFRHRLFDDDNNVNSFKQLRDAIAATLGIDDADRRITFECSQVKTDGEQGVVVKIERSA